MQAAGVSPDGCKRRIIDVEAVAATPGHHRAAATEPVLGHMQQPLGSIQGTLARAVAAHQAGKISEAEFLYKLVLQADKKQFDAMHMLAIIEGQRGNFAA